MATNNATAICNIHGSVNLESHAGAHVGTGKWHLKLTSEE